jgi:hypothetical protein
VQHAEADHQIEALIERSRDACGRSISR